MEKPMEFKDYYKIIGVRCNAIQDIPKGYRNVIRGSKIRRAAVRVCLSPEKPGIWMQK
jgi:hypothetical protein